MKAILVHGWEGRPDNEWRPWLRQELEKNGFTVTVPAMPNTSIPTLEKWVPYLAHVVGKPDEQTYLVGHSLGCVTILRYLETLRTDERAGGAIFVSGFGYDLEHEGYKGELSSFFKTPINWEKVKTRCNKFVAIHSDDDPWVPIKHNALFKDKLDAKSIIQHGMGHYSEDENITELPIVLHELLEISRKK